MPVLPECDVPSPTHVTLLSEMLLSAIAASMIQGRGTTDGWYLDPRSLDLLLQGPAMERALELLRRLAAAGTPAPACVPVHPGFAEGSCLMEVNMAYRFKVGTEGTWAERNGDRGALYPGSVGGLGR